MASKRFRTTATTRRQRHTYDEANRLTDEGVEYDPFGNTTSLPAADAGGHTLASSFYVDNQAHTQAQEGKELTYSYDPDSRPLETKTKLETETVSVDHYAGTGETASWIAESTGKWTRQIPGIDGQLAAVQTNAATTVLQLHDLQGDIVATIALSEHEGKLLSTYQSSEFGVPTSSKPPAYGWLGGAGLSSQLPTTGIINTGQGAYIPEIGRPLQTETIMPPSLGASSHSEIETPWSAAAFNDIEKGKAIERQVAEEKAAAEEARKHQEEEFICASCEIRPDENLPEVEEGGAEGTEEWEEGSGGDPVATVAARMSTPEGRYAEAQCDRAAEKMESHGHEVGNFTGKYQTKPGRRYKGTEYELLYETEPILLPFGAHTASIGGKVSVCQVIVDNVKGRYRTTHGPHFRLGQGLRNQNLV